jgi:calcineurin-like phosphoesterase family protein
MHGHARNMRLARLRCVLYVACFLAAPMARAAGPDGPYVVDGAAGLEAWSIVEGRKRTEPLSENAVITIPAVGALPAFKVRLRPPAADAPDVVKFSAKSPLFVVADTHGEFEILARMLISQKVVDANLQWRFGRGHVVVLGDVFDRGPNHLEILWLLYGLEAQAAKAGGGVHLVLGNHETMVLGGDLRYLNPKYVESAAMLGVRSYSELFGARTVLGRWLRAQPVMLKVNDLLCLHAGVSRALLDRKLTLAQINSTVRAAMSGTLSDDAAASELARFLVTTNGPLWYRGYFPEHADYTPATAEDVDATLAAFGVSRVLVGHTIVPAITPLYGGKVIAVQVYPKRDDAGVKFESLLLRGGKLLRATPDGKVEGLVSTPTS